MTNKWRIKKVVNGFGAYYILQKRLLGFLWWFNPDNIDGSTTGVYSTLSEAKEMYKKKTIPTKVAINDTSFDLR